MQPAELRDDFRAGPSPHWLRQEVGHGRLERQPGSLRLALDRAEEGSLSDAEIGDYQGRPRSDLPWRPPLRLEVVARFSASADRLLGTAGFGFWNHPFPGGRVETAPNAVWFFFASPPSRLATATGTAGTGWTATSWNGGTLPGPVLWLGALSLRLPGFRWLAMRAADRQVHASERVLEPELMRSQRRYAMTWRAEEVSFSVDGEAVHSSPQPPRGPLGFVAWMDNQFAVVEPSGTVRFGHLGIGKPQWMELSEISIDPLDDS